MPKWHRTRKISWGTFIFLDNWEGASGVSDRVGALKLVNLPGTWQTFEGGVAESSLELVYPLETGKLKLEINNAKLKEAEDKISAATFFSGSFAYPLLGETKAEKLVTLHTRINGWQENVQAYCKFIEQEFLQTLMPKGDATA